MITMPIQKALKLPAVRPDSTFSDAPPSRLAVTTSSTWRLSVLVKTLTSSGMTAPARVPQLMITMSFHHSVPSPRFADRAGTRPRRSAPTLMIDVSHTSTVSGISKLNLSALPMVAFWYASLTR